MTADGRATVLLVEDDADVRDAVADTLDDAGYRVLVAVDGKDALERLRDGARPCVILLDLMMPIMDGWAFRDRQRADPSIAAIPVVVLSAHADLSEFDADAHLRKPFGTKLLLETIARFCAR